MTKSTNRMGESAAGFTLLEVLVAVMVLSIGLLGLASLQVNGLRFNHSAYMRTQATLLAEEIADRMRANRPGFNARSSQFYDQPNTLAAALVPACETAAGCSPTQMAQHDIAQWQQNLAALLPNGQGIVCIDTVPIVPVNLPAPGTCNNAGANTAYAIKIWWDDNRDGTADQNFTVTLN